MALPVKEHHYIGAAQALGAQLKRVVFQHIVPNIMTAYIIMLTARFGGTILAEATPSCLGLREGKDQLRERQQDVHQSLEQGIDRPAPVRAEHIPRTRGQRR